LCPYRSVPDQRMRRWTMMRADDEGSRMASSSDDDQRFAGIDRLYGRGSLARLAQARVCIIGVGGVGSWAVEALARSGVGHLTVIDADDICVSNVNRQLHALDGQFGRVKVEAMAERARAISPRMRIDAIAQFLTAGNLEEMLARDFDVVLDACDSLRVKVEMIAFCRRRKLPIVTVGSAGGRTDPTRIQVRDLSRTELDAMLALVRKRLRAEHGFPRNPDRYFGVSAVYSMENVRYPQADGSVCGVRPAMGADAALKLDCGAGLGAATHVTGGFAFAAVGRVLSLLLAPPKSSRAVPDATIDKVEPSLLG
jgi:tRNA A37 threonylcarbamoyladenosine dehydratase